MANEAFDENGTPKTLHAAIALGLCAGPLAKIDINVKAHVKDFLAQRFGAYVLSHPEQEDMLMELFDEIVK